MEITVRTSGYMACKPGHTYGPAVREYFLFHLVLSGRGVYEVGGRRYNLHAGQGFMIFPGVTTIYAADKQEPWTYVWLGFHSTETLWLINSLGLSEERPVWEMNEDEATQHWFRRIVLDARETPELLRYKSFCAGAMLSFLSTAACAGRTPVSQALSYCREAVGFMRSHMDKHVTVEEIAAYVGLSRSQLFRIFKNTYGQSVMEVQALLRMEQAQNLLLSTSLPLAHIADLCGYASPAHFSASFKRISGVSPSQYRLENSEKWCDE